MASVETEVWTAIKPEGTALALLVTTCIFTILIFIVLPLRFYTRLSTRTLGFEDWLMFAGFVDVITQNAFIIYGSYTGIGSPDTMINTPRMIQCGLVVVFWQMTYVTSTALIKCSILWTLIRLATQKKYLYPLYALFGVSAVVGFVSFFVALLRCKPINAAWTGKGTCLSQDVIIGFSYGISSLNIFIDFATAIIPIFLLRSMQMKRKLKVVTSGILGLGILASIATIIRMPYCNAYSLKHNQMSRMGDLLLWTNFECGFGIIAGSLPMLRKLFKSLAASENKSSSNRRGMNLVTIGGGIAGTGRSISKMKFSRNPYGSEGMTVLATAAAADEVYYKDRDSDRDSGKEGDDESTKKMIRVTRRIEQTVTTAE
ncbi:unnamed protein product [Discula destructiva]